METVILIFSSVVFAWLIGEYNATAYLMYLGDKESKTLPSGKTDYNTLFHRLGFLIRFLWWVIIVFFSAFLVSDEFAGFIASLNVVLLWTGYNLIYNFRHGHPWWYIGSKASNTSSFVDKFFRRAVYSGQFLFLLLTVFYYPIYKAAMRMNFDYLITILIASVALHLVISFHWKKG